MARGAVIHRRVASALLDTEHPSGRVRDYCDMWPLVGALYALVLPETGIRQVG